MRENWWKFTGVIIILFSLLAGLLVPLGPGLLEVRPDVCQGGQLLQLQAEGYNTHFEEATAHAAWLKLSEEHLIEASEIEVINNRLISMRFAIPAQLPFEPSDYSLSLIVSNSIDGAFVLPGAVFIQPKSVQIVPGKTEGWISQLPALKESAGIRYPYRNILYETIRNTYYHVPLWFAMIILMAASMVYSIRYLRSFRPERDMQAAAFARVGLLFGLLGISTGAIWANYTWGAPWSNDIKQLVSAVALLIYLAYFILRMALENPIQRARVSAVYNVFAFAALIPLLFIIPRLSEVGSLHPGNGGNPAMGGEDLDNTMRLVFYPAIIGWTLIGVWLSTLWYRYRRVSEWVEEEAYQAVGSRQ